MTDRPDRADPSPTGRQAGLDLLRAAMTLLVLYHHTAITYGAMGGWFYRERPEGSSLVLTFFCTVNQAFFMGLFFLLAGTFTPGALASKGPIAWLRDRALRLGVPLLGFGLVLGPITIALAQTARGRDFGDTLMALWRRGVFEPGPLWFAEALLIFAVLLLALPGARRLITSSDRAAAPLPTDRALWLAALGTGGAAWTLRLVWPVGWNVWGLQWGYFASYLLLFAVGCLAGTPRWLERLPDAMVRRWRRIAWAALPVLPVLALSGLPGPAEGGWHPLALVYAFWEPFVAWGVILGLLLRFQRHFSAADPGLGRWSRDLARRAYAIYVIHPPVLVAVSLAWRDVAAPGLLKFALTGTVTCGLCFVLAGLLLRLPGVRRVL